jgi:hypothetical protein
VCDESRIIIGPMFYNTVNATRYVNIIRPFFRPNIKRQHCVFLQDTASAHMLHANFGSTTRGLRGPLHYLESMAPMFPWFKPLWHLFVGKIQGQSVWNKSSQHPPTDFISFRERVHSVSRPKFSVSAVALVSSYYTSQTLFSLLQLTVEIHVS